VRKRLAISTVATHAVVVDSAAPLLGTLKWKFKTNGKIFSTPAIAGGVAYFGSTDHNLYAVGIADGSLVWKFRTGLGVNSSPAVEKGVVYANSLDDNFYAVDAESGKVKWKFATGGEHRFTANGIHGIGPSTETMPDPFDVFISSPTLAGGIVYFGSVVHATPAIADGVLYVGSWDRNLYALNAQTESLMWKFQTGDDPKVHNQIGFASSPAVTGGVVGCRDGHFYAVDAKTSQQKWA
jgi:outer membrane protein assembly factor BamB